MVVSMTSARHERRGRGVGEGGDRHHLRGYDVRAWALPKGLVADADAIEVICCTKRARSAGRHGFESELDFDRWTVLDVEELLWVELVSYCSDSEQPVPERLAETLWTYLSYMADTGALIHPSDTLPTLRTPLIAYGGLGANGRRRPQRPQRPSRRAARSSTPRAITPRATARKADPAEDAPLARIIPLRPRWGLTPVAGA
jgi:hypothetical protein